MDQAPFVAAVERDGEDAVRADVLAGGYRLVEAPPGDGPAVTIAASGAVVVEALAAARELADEGVDATVVDVTSVDRLLRSWRAATAGAAASGRPPHDDHHLARLVPAGERGRPLVSVHDASGHTLAWMGSALGVRQIALGVERFGESGTIADLHELTGISSGHIVNAALAVL